MAIERGRIDASEAGPRELRDQTEAQTGFGYQASAIHAGSMFGNGSQTPLAFVFEKEMNMDYGKIYIDADCSMHELKDILSSDKEDIFGDENYVRVFVAGMTAPIPKGGNREPSFHQQSEPHSILKYIQKKKATPLNLKKKSLSLLYSFVNTGLMSLLPVILKISLLKRPVGTGRKKSRCRLQ